MSRAILAWSVLVSGLVRPSNAQTVRARVYAASVTDRTSGVLVRQSASGFGAGGGVELAKDRFVVEADGLQAWMTRGPDSARTRWRALQVDLRTRFTVGPFLAPELGFGHRFLSPDSDGERVGFVRIGVLFQQPLVRGASIWARVAYLPYGRFSGGGNLTLGAEVSAGIEAPLVGDWLQGVVRYDFQRLDRRLGGRKSPIEFDFARVGALLTP